MQDYDIITGKSRATLGDWALAILALAGIAFLVYAILTLAFS